MPVSGFTPSNLISKDMQTKAFIFPGKAGHKILYEVAYHIEMHFYYLHSSYAADLIMLLVSFPFHSV